MSFLSNTRNKKHITGIVNSELKPGTLVQFGLFYAFCYTILGQTFLSIQNKFVKSVAKTFRKYSLSQLLFLYCNSFYKLMSDLI